MRLWMVCLFGWLCMANAALAAEPSGGNVPETGGISGRIMQNGQPFPGGAVVSLFNAASGSPPDQGSVRRVPDGLIKVDDSGDFRETVPPGKYYLGALGRSDRERMGPPGPDEKFFFARDAEGKLRLFEVLAGQLTETGVLSGIRAESFPEIVNPLTVEGTLYDEQGRPFSGALILVRSDLKVPKPLFISPRTGADGRYQLKIPAGGPYYLVARESLVDVGRPAPGSFIGTYGAAKPLSNMTPSMFNGGLPVAGEGGALLKGIDIVLYKVPDPEEVGAEIRQQTESATSQGSPKK